MNCIIDVGGGNRGIYGAGVFDYCLDNGIGFDACVGVSAGCANIASFLAKQKGRNYRFYHDYSQRKEYMSLENFLKSGEYLGLDYIYSTVSNSTGENPLDYEKMSAYTGSFITVVTNAVTGETEYLDMGAYAKDDYTVLKATCCIPCVCKPVTMNGKEYYDGGVSDPLPIEYALNYGFDKIYVILTKPVSYRKSAKPEKAASALLRRKYPLLSAALPQGAERYNQSVELALRLQKEGKCIIIAPEACKGVGTLKSSQEGLDRLYKNGYENAGALLR